MHSNICTFRTHTHSSMQTNASSISIHNFFMFFVLLSVLSVCVCISLRQQRNYILLMRNIAACTVHNSIEHVGGIKVYLYIYFVRVCVNHYKWQNLYGAFVYLALTKRAYILFCTMEFVVQRRAKCSDQPSNFVCMAFHLVLLQLLFLDLSINDPMMSVRG